MESLPAALAAGEAGEEDAPADDVDLGGGDVEEGAEGDEGGGPAEVEDDGGEGGDGEEDGGHGADDADFAENAHGAHLLFSTKTQKERKGLGTSPFGALRLTPYPYPLRFYRLLGSVLAENRRFRKNTEFHRDDRGTQRRAAGYRRQDCQCEGTAKTQGWARTASGSIGRSAGFAR